MILKKFIFLIVICLTISSCYSEKKQSLITESATVKQDVVPDSIMNFPNGGRIWIALKTTNQKKVAEAIGLEDYESINWENGFKNSGRTNRFDNRVFITPVVDSTWTLVTGYDLPRCVDRNLEDFAKELSTTFGNLSYYYIGKETFGLAKASNGILERYIYYNNNSVITEKGEKTEAEKKTPLSGGLDQFRFSEKLTKALKKSPSTFNSLYSDIEYSIGADGDVYEQYTIPWPNSPYIYKIAEQWSINPKTFIENGSTSENLGMLGKTNEKY